MITVGMPIEIIIDILAVLVFVWFGYVGWKKGFVRYFTELFRSLFLAFVSIIAAYILSGKYDFYPEKYIPQLIIDFGFKEFFTRFIAFVAFFAVIFAVLLLITKPLNTLARKVNRKNTVNQVCGCVLGVLFANTINMLIAIAFVIALREPIVINGRNAVDHTLLNFSLKTGVPAVRLINKAVGSSRIDQILDKAVITAE